MDLTKIGRYIAGKRKELGLTQKQLAEKLGMSDKSVSKWERGICLPDVAIYMELCGILGISINEFLAGEDISKENIIKKTDDNLIQVSRENKSKLKSLQGIILVLLLVAIAALAMSGILFFRHLNQPKNYISAVDRNSAEMKTAELLSGIDGAFMFRYFSRDPFKTLTVYMSEYRNGELISKSKAGTFAYEDIASPANGMIVLVPDFKSSSVKLIVSDAYARISSAIPILENVEDAAYWGRSAVQLQEETALRYNFEHGLVGLIYDKDTLSAVSVEAMENGEFHSGNDYVYYFSVQFSK